MVTGRQSRQGEGRRRPARRPPVRRGAYRTEVQRAEDFNRALRAQPADWVAAALERQLADGTRELFAAFADKQGPVERRRAAVLGVAVTAMAQAELRAPHAPAELSQQPSWLTLARTAISRFATEQPEAKDTLLATVFFNPDPAAACELDRRVSASIEPAGWYDGRAFAAGIASGRLRAVADASSAEVL